ncbi:hypothetical protein JYT32_01010, partial [Dehalococcoides mccartyi]|nr:hypothetical protein [Dehalococcoides mccartyi]
MAYAFIGMTTLAAIFAFVALDAVDKSTDAILRERLNLATTVAQSIDQTILASKSLVLLTANDLGSARPESGEQSGASGEPKESGESSELTLHEIAMLNSLRVSLADVNAGMLPESVVLFDSDGKIVWQSYLQAETEREVTPPDFFGEAESLAVHPGGRQGQGYSTFSVGAEI